MYYVTIPSAKSLSAFASEMPLTESKAFFGA